jgi:glucose-1-phosphate thymidylyltransferase
MKGIILAGGHGTRLRPLTFTGNKHMIPIANKPMLLYGIGNLSKAGIKEIGVILGPLNEGVKESIGDGSRFGVKVTYLSQPDPKGLAHAVLVAEDFIQNEPFIMYLGDNLLKQGVMPLIDSYSSTCKDCIICVTRVNNPSQYGIVELDEEGNVVRLIEKPREPRSNLALVGAYLFNRSIFHAAKKIEPSWRNELEITDAIQFLLEHGYQIGVQYINGWWKDTGKPDDLLDANQFVLDDMESTNGYNIANIDSSCLIRGKVSIGRNTVVKSNTRIKGPVIIGENCEIGPDVYIGPYTSIGNNSKIISSEIEGSIVMQNTTINCNKRIVDSIIGRNSRLESARDALPSGLRFIVGESTLCRV